MTDERLALLVRAAMRGFMEAVLAVDPEPALPPAVVKAFGESGRVEPQSEEIPFPSVTAAEETLFGEIPPPLVGIDRAVSDYATMRQRQAQDAAPDVQGGPGEKEVAEWLRIPQQ